MDPVIDSGGRVTRSLRKRISSVDCDNSSRPGTPVPSKLTAITEISSPSRPTRMTRRNSTSGVSTPVKTPAKRGAAATPAIIAESTEAVTPARRNTRRRSVSINEDEETSQTLKAPSFEAVAEEIVITTGRLTRSQSKSPEQIKAISSPVKKNEKIHDKSAESIKSGENDIKTPLQKRRKPGPKSKTILYSEETEDLSDDEVITSKNHEVKEENKSIDTIDLSDGDEDILNLNKNNLSAKKSQTKNEKKSMSIKSPQKSKDELNVSNSKKISEHLNKSKLCNEESEKENNEPTVKCNDSSINLKETEDLSDVEVITSKNLEIKENKSIYTIDLSDCDEDSINLNKNNLSSKKSPEKNEKKRNYSPQKFKDELNVSTSEESNNHQQFNKSILSNEESEKDNNESVKLNDCSTNLKETKDLSNVEVIVSKNHEIKENKTIVTIDLSDCDENSLNLNKNNLSCKKSPEKNEKKRNSPRKSKDELKVSTSEESNSHKQLDKSKLSKEKSKRENNESNKLNDSSISLKETEDLSDVEVIVSKNHDTIDMSDCNENSTNLNKNNLNSKKSQKKNEKSPKKSKDKLNVSTSDDFNIHPQLDKSTLSKEELEKETNNDSKILENLNDQKTEASSTRLDKNVTIIDLIDANIEPQEENKITDSPKPKLSETNIENDKKSDAITSNENISNNVPMKQTTNKCEEISNESLTEEAAPLLMESLIVINETLLNDESNSEEISTEVSDIQKEKIESQPCLSTNQENDMMITVTPEKKSKVIITEVININCTLTPTEVKSSKKVEFISRPIRDDTIKSVYPKTPASLKNKIFFCKDSSMDSSNTIDDEVRKCLQDDDIVEDEIPYERMEVDEMMEVDDHDVVEDQKQTNISTQALTNVQKSINEQNSPTNLRKSINEQNTPIIESKESAENKNEEFQNDNNSKNNTKSLEKSCPTDLSDEQKLNDDVTENSDQVSSTKEIENQIKWINPSVKGYVTEGSKIDVVVQQTTTHAKNLLNNNIDNDDEKINKTKKCKAIFSSSESSGDEDEEEKHDEEEEEGVELAPGEEPYQRKHIFLEDEAQVIDDYESGDSMDSEERREIMENEIPIDGESIGSKTTDDENDEYENDEEGEEDSENDSFIVDDNEEEENVQLEISDSDENDDEDDIIDNKGSKKKIYTRIQNPIEDSSTSSDELEEEEVETELKVESSTKINTSTLSESALRLQCTADNSETEELEENNAEISRKDILQKLNQSERFNKSVRDLNSEIDNSPNETNKEKNKEIEEIHENKKDDNEKNADSSITSSSSEEIEEKSGKRVRRSESQLGEVSITTESDGDKENNTNQTTSNQISSGRGLSVSFGSYKMRKSNEKKQCQRSFTIGVSVKAGGNLDTAVIENKSTTIDNNSSSPTFSDQDDEELSSDDVNVLEKIRHMPLPLGNPLGRTRRQSLALPSNPDKEIFSSPYCGGANKKPKRSLGMLSSNDFNPSQSFIDSIQLHKNENRQSAKRKRLSKSFCGASETLDNSVIDIDVGHLHKRSKLALDQSVMENYDSMENINSCKLSSKNAISSTPCEKIDKKKKDTNNNLKHILSRCDEILEAANRAKLEMKMNNKKSKVKLPKKNRKKNIQRVFHEEHKGDDDDDKPKTFSKKMKHNDKVRAAALAQALKAAGSVIVGKQKPKHVEKSQGDMGKRQEEDTKCLSSDVLEAIAENVEKKNNKKDLQNDQQKLPNHHVNVMTSTGNFVEMPQTPKKKKIRTEFIQMATGKFFVEPVTPKKRSVLACNGTEFRESPITPSAAGFKISNIPNNDHIGKQQTSILKNRKRKRNYDEQTGDHPSMSSKSQWTQSGVFIEEEISTVRPIIASSDVKQQTGGSRGFKNVPTEQTAYCNFKQNALMRGDIRRCTTRELLQIKERRQNQFY